jgi:acetolactate synthase small subunit
MSVERAAMLLATRGGYRRASEPLHVADLAFQFDAVFVGPNDQQHLVVIYDANQDRSDAVARRLRAFGVVLQRSGTRRSVTLVVLNSAGTRSRLRELEDVCRVVYIESERTLEDELAILLPLPIPEPLNSMRTAEAALQRALGPQQTDPLTSAILTAAASGGESAVRDAMLQYLSQIADRALEEADDDSAH